MARLKNALRVYAIAAYTEGSSVPAPPTVTFDIPTTGSPGASTMADDANWKRLAKYIQTVDDATNEDTEDEGFYDSDGTAITSVTGLGIGYSFSGFYDETDEAQKLIHDLRLQLERKVYLAVFEPPASGTTASEVLQGKATISAIDIGTGDAVDFQSFGCDIIFDELPKPFPENA
jgi:hypothetical protein